MLPMQLCLLQRTPAHDRVVVVVDLHLEAKPEDSQDEEVAGDDPVAAAEVLPASVKDHLTQEVLDLNPELAPLVGRQCNDARGLDHQPLLHHLRELGRDDEHGEILHVLDLNVETQRLSCPLFVAGAQRPSP